MRYRIRYRYPAPPEQPQRLYLLLPEDLPGQRIDAARLSLAPKERLSEANRSLACFELPAGSRLELDFELETSSTFQYSGHDSDEEVRSLIEAAYSQLSDTGYRLLGNSDVQAGEASLRLSLAVVAEARIRGWSGEVMLGHLLLGKPTPHAWCRLQTPAGAVICDPWLHLVLPVIPGFWLSQGLAPDPEDYLHGHEGRRLSWGSGPLPADSLPCTEERNGETPADSVFFWPDSPWTPEQGFKPPSARELNVKTLGLASAQTETLEAFRFVALTGLLLVSLGLLSPGGWPLLAYAGYASLLAWQQGRAWLKLWKKTAGRRIAFESALFHVAFLAVVAGWETVLPQTAFALTWIFNRLEPLALTYLGSLPSKDEAG